MHRKLSFLKKSCFSYFVLIASTLLVSCADDSKYSKPLLPENALFGFQLDDQFQVELFASEPIVEEPIEMVIDEKGHVYVIEMPDFADESEDDPGNNRIKVLRDTDDDGKMDDFIIFADGIKEATSLQPWKGGLLVTAAPYIYYMKDTDGDFKADEKEILFTGFFQNNQDAQITSLRFNVDNWMYASNHGQAGEVKFNRKPSEDPLPMQGADFRFRLDKGKFERETAPGQFGQALDDMGHRFITQNTIHIQEMVIPWRYLHRHDYLPATKGVLNISDHDLRMYQISDPPYWRVQRSNRRQAKFDEQGLNRTEYIDNHFTGASGGTYYGGDLFPLEYQGNIFTGDVMGNLVHRDVLRMEPGQPYFTAKRAASEQKREFLASKDPWFRPVSFTVGPDGALYVIDMYRQHIEAPFSIPDDLKEDMDYLNGEDMGRIYRIVPKGFSGPAIPEEVKKEKSSENYVEWLTKPNQWYRLHGQRLLLEKQDKSIVPAVRDIFENNEDPIVRLNAFYVLDGLDALDPGVIKKALEDPSNGVKEHALIQAEKYSELLPDIMALSNDSSARIVMQTALSLGEFEPSKEIKTALSEILINNYSDYFIRLAVLSSKAGSSLELINSLVNRHFFDIIDEDKLELATQLGYSYGARTDKNAKMEYCNLISNQPKVFIKSTVKGFYDGTEKSKLELPNELKSLLERIDSAD